MNKATPNPPDSGLPVPNYTQMPNVLLDHMHEMTDGEMRVLFALCRQTLGWHKKRVKISLTMFQRLTGLSRQGVVNALRGEMCKRFIERTPDGQGYFYRLVFKYEDEPKETVPEEAEDAQAEDAQDEANGQPVNSVDHPDTPPTSQLGRLPLVNSVDHTSQLSRLPLVNSVDHIKRKRKKKERKEKERGPTGSARSSENWEQDFSFLTERDLKRYRSLFESKLPKIIDEGSSPDPYADIETVWRNTLRRRGHTPNAIERTALLKFLREHGPEPFVGACIIAGAIGGTVASLEGIAGVWKDDRQTMTPTIDWEKQTFLSAEDFWRKKHEATKQ